MRIPHVSPVFIGRTPQLAELRRGLDRVRAGEPSVHLIGGEAGVGKTRLVEEFTDRAETSGALVAVGGCVELGADGLPFAPVSAALRSLHRRLGDELPAAAPPGGELSVLLPELGDGTAPHRFGDAGDRARLFESTARLLENLAGRRPLVIVLEDLHWSDRSTRELLDYLHRSVRDAGLMLVATYRTDDIHRRHPLRPFLAELERSRTVHRLELPRLTEAEVAEQMTGIIGERPEPARARTVFDRSGGNPFFVEELTGCCPGQGMHESLRDLLLVRVEALPDTAQEVLRLLAVGGSTVGHGLLAAVAGLPESDLHLALRAAVGGHLLVAEEETGAYRFRHALMREAVADDLLPGERTRINRRYAEALEEAPHLVPADQHAARLAGYWYHAGVPDRALPAVLRAADRARRRHAHAEQLRLLDRALELWDAVPEEVLAKLRPVGPIWVYPSRDGAPVDEVDLLAEATMTAVLAEQMDVARRMSKRALRLLTDTSDPLRTAWFLMQRSRMFEGVVRGPDRELLRRARELLEGLPPSAVHAQVLALGAAQRADDEHTPEALAAAQRAVEVARELGVESTELYARLTLAGVRANAGEGAGALVEMRAVLDRVVRRADADLLGRTLNNLIATLGLLGRFGEAVETAEWGRALASRFGLEETARTWLATNHAAILVQLGRWSAAEDILREVEGGNANPRPVLIGRILRAHLAVLRGDIGVAREMLVDIEERAEREIDRIGGTTLAPQYLLPLTELRVVLAAAAGDLPRVRELFAERIPDLNVPHYQALSRQLLVAVAAAEADGRGDPASVGGAVEARTGIAAASATVSRGEPIWAVLADLTDILLASAEGRATPGDWERMVVRLEPMGTPHRLAEVRIRWAESLLPAGGPPDRERAAGLLAAARATAVDLGARPLMARIDRLTAAARLVLPGEGPAEDSSTEGDGEESGEVGPAPADRAAAFGLTARERDVLALVAAGRTNRQIAGELFIAPKTASVHVSNILAKLEVGGRGEAAALAHRLRLVEPAEGAGTP
ncbi:helix-turn-helix transcriptional regulator [Streptomyces alkaliphilus]|uniref:helix-turn-helix transcriptional regulator n=1 Tax=Streptomyces alkaliphilus TaxID=1472722 RepID=UPI00117D07CF|nr:AAA family ATPase [Streptomyces alkaliphilus]